MPSETGGDAARGPMGMPVPGFDIHIWSTLAFLVAQWLLGTPPSLSIRTFLP